MTPYAPYPLNLLRDGLHRWRWVIRGVLTAVLVPWAVFWAHGRWNAEPALPGVVSGAVDHLDPALNIPPPELDVTQELAAAFNALPPLPAIKPLPAPPEGKKWRALDDSTPIRTTIYPAETLKGPWQPDSRLQQMLFVEYLNDPKVVASLEEIVELSDRPSCLSHSSALGWSSSTFRTQIWSLVARSRLHAEEGSYEAALRDLQTVCHLARTVTDDGPLLTMMIGDSHYAKAYGEFIAQARTLPQPAEHRLAVLRWLKDHPVDAVRLWQEAARGESRYFEYWVDGYYTRDEEGNGVYTYDSTTLAPGLDSFGRIQNLMGHVYDDRQSYLAFLQQIWGEAVPDAIALPYPLAESTLQEMTRYRPPTHVEHATSGLGRWAFTIARSRTFKQITLATLAVLTYHAEKGAYPERLSDLVPDYLDQLPIDGFTDEPLRYRLDQRYGFIVYSVGENLRDDGGQFEKAPGEDLAYDKIHDYFFSRPQDGKWRDEPTEEWILVPADAEDPAEPIDVPDAPDFEGF